MCMSSSERESILQEAREATGDMIRNKAWMRAKTELQIMIDTLEETDNEGHAKKLEDLIKQFIYDLEEKCFHM